MTALILLALFGIAALVIVLLVTALERDEEPVDDGYLRQVAPWDPPWDNEHVEYSDDHHAYCTSPRCSRLYCETAGRLRWGVQTQ